MKFIRHEEKIYNLNQLEFMTYDYSELILQFKNRYSKFYETISIKSYGGENDVESIYLQICKFIKNNEILFKICSISEADCSFLKEEDIDPAFKQFSTY